MGLKVLCLERWMTNKYCIEQEALYRNPINAIIGRHGWYKANGKSWIEMPFGNYQLDDVMSFDSHLAWLNFIERPLNRLQYEALKEASKSIEETEDGAVIFYDTEKLWMYELKKQLFEARINAYKRRKRLKQKGGKWD